MRAWEVIEATDVVYASPHIMVVKADSERLMAELLSIPRWPVIADVVSGRCVDLCTVHFSLAAPLQDTTAFEAWLSPWATVTCT